MSTDTTTAPEPITTTIEPPVEPQLVLKGTGDIVLVPANAYGRRDEVLAVAKSIRAVFDIPSRDAAIKARAELKEARVQLGKFKDFAKAPVTALAKKVEAEMAEFTKEVGCGTGEDKKGSEEKRLDALLVRFENEQRAIREKAEKERLDKLEEDRLAEIERQKEIARREQEAANKLKEAEEAQAKADRARSEAGRDKALQTAEQASLDAQAAQEQADKLALEAEEAEIDRRQRAQQEADAAAAKAAEAPTPGYKPKDVWEFEVLNILQLAMHNPDLVKIEPRKDKINEAIANGDFDFSPAPSEVVGAEWENCKVREGVYRTAPGIRIFKRTKV